MVAMTMASPGIARPLKLEICCKLWVVFHIQLVSVMVRGLHVDVSRGN